MKIILGVLGFMNLASAGLQTSYFVFDHQAYHGFLALLNILVAVYVFWVLDFIIEIDKEIAELNSNFQQKMDSLLKGKDDETHQ